MQIKDVEKLTGLSAKSIRYYEAKGLLIVERKAENGYRLYSEENIQQLKRIKVLRYLEFSIEEISKMQALDAAGMKKALTDKMEDLDDKSRNLEMKCNLCRSLSKDHATLDHVIDEYNDVVDMLEDPELSEAVDALKDLSCPNISEVLGMTLIGLGPILWLFYNIQEQSWSKLMLNAVIALAGAALITASWMRYLYERRRNPKRVKKNDRSAWYVIPACVLAVIAAIILSVFIFTGILETLLAPEGWLFYQMTEWAERGIIYLMMIPMVYFLAGLLKILSGKIKKTEGEKQFLLFRRYWYICIAVWLAGIYLCLTSVTYVTEDQIIRRTPFCPQGKTYAYQDVTHVKAGFGQAHFAIHDYKKMGEFYYIVTLDGKKIILHQPGVNDTIKRYEEHTYFELEEFDAALMKLGITKESSSAGYEACDFDKEYVERFLKIVNNK